jgi:hypothetical protein
MKKFSFFAGMILLAASCSNDRVESVDNVQVENVVAPVTVCVSGFSITQEGFSGTRSTAVADYSGVKALTIAFYKVDDGSEVYKNTQFRDNLPEGETFGAFTTTLSAGNYTMVVLGYGQGQSNQAITMTSATAATYGEGTVYDTFAATQEVSITNSDAKNLTATLQRIVTALAVQSTDLKPEGVTHMRLTYYGGGKSFNPTTGLATSNDGFVSLAGLPTAGNTTYTGNYFFLASDEQTINVKIETMDGADGNVLYSKTVENVPLKRNRQTTLIGAIYSNARVSGSSFEISESWLDAHVMSF